MTAQTRIASTWIALMVLGLASLWLTGIDLAAGPAFAVIIGIAAVKAMLVAWCFMHLGKAPLSWRLSFAGVIAMVASAIMALHLLA